MVPRRKGSCIETIRQPRCPVQRPLLHSLHWMSCQPADAGPPPFGPSHRATSNAAVAVVQSHHDPAPLRSLALLRWPAKKLFLDGKPPIETLARMGGGVADFFPGTRPAGSVASGDTPGEGEARGVIRSGPVASGDSSSGRRGAGAAVPVAGSLPYAQATRGQHQCRQ